MNVSCLVRCTNFIGQKTNKVKHQHFSLDDDDDDDNNDDGYGGGDDDDILHSGIFTNDISHDLVSPYEVRVVQKKPMFGKIIRIEYSPCF